MTQGPLPPAVSPARVAELRRIDETLRAPLTGSVRVAFVGAASGVGCSSLAGLVASTLAVRRAHRVLAVNASVAGRSLLVHAGFAGDATTTPARDLLRRTARTAREAAAGLPRTATGLHCLDLHRAAECPAGRAARPDARWGDAVGPAGRFFDVVVTDWGVRDATSLDAVTSWSDVVCVVTEADRAAVQQGVDLAVAAGTAGAAPVLAVVDRLCRRPAGLGELVRLLPVPAVVVTHDGAHTADRVSPARLRASTNLAVLRLAATVLSGAGADRPSAPATEPPPGRSRSDALVVSPV